MGKHGRPDLIMISAILVLFATLGSARSASLGLGDCPQFNGSPKPPTVQDANVTAYLGDWYQYEGLPAFFAPSGTSCIRARYGDRGDGTVSVRNALGSSHEGYVDETILDNEPDVNPRWLSKAGTPGSEAWTAGGPKDGSDLSCRIFLHHPQHDYKGVWHEPPLHLPLGQVRPIGTKWDDVDRPAHHGAHHRRHLWLDGDDHQDHHPHQDHHHKGGGVWAKDRGAAECSFVVLLKTFVKSFYYYLTVPI